MECSNAGVCDGESGTCSCFDGYTGLACQRLACSNGCSGHGSCITTHQAGLTYGRDTPAGFSPGGDGRGPAYTNWDGHVTTLCACDTGFFGADCSLRMCPKGDDPLTSGQAARALTLTTAGASALGGTLTVSFDGEEFTMSADANAVSGAECKALLEGLPNIEVAACARGAPDAQGGAVYSIELSSFPTLPHQNNIFAHDGNPPLSSFTCDVSAASPAGMTCLFADTTTSNLREYEFCSGRGTCDTATGSCTCYADFSGTACEAAASTVATSADNDVLLLHAQLAGYAGKVLHLKTEREAADAFDLVYAQSNSAATFQMKGNGDTIMHKGGLTISIGGETISAGGLTVNGGGTIATGGLVVAQDGQTIAAGGLQIDGGGVTIASGGGTIDADGLTVADGGATISEDDADAKVLTVSSGAASHSSATNIFEVTAAAEDGTSHNLIAATGNGASIFRVNGLPRTYIDVGGLDVTGGQTIQSGGLLVSAGGATVASPGLVVTGGTTVSTEDLVIDSAKVTGAPSATGDAGALSLQGGEAAAGGGRRGGDLFLLSGYSADSTSGHVSLRTADAGGAGVSGSVDVLTGHASLGDSGRVTLRSGAAASGAGGRILISVGDGDAGGSGGGGGGGGGLSLFSGSTTASGAAGGAVTVTSGAGATSGAVAISSGGSGAASGSVALTSGDGTTAGSGTLTARTGAATTGTSGSAAFGSGATAGSGGGDTGAVSVTSGSSGGGASGALTIGTGIGGGGDAGGITMASGASTGGRGGHILISVGDGGAGAGGELRLVGGKSAGTRGGKVRVEAGDGSSAAGGDVELVPGGGSTEGAIKAFDGAGNVRLQVSGTGVSIMDGGGSEVVTVGSGLSLASGTGTGTAVTINRQAGTVAVPASSLAPNGTETIAVTNALVTTASVIVASVASPCAGGQVAVLQAVPSEGNAAIMVKNVGGAPCSTGYKVAFLTIA